MNVESHPIGTVVYGQRWPLLGSYVVTGYQGKYVRLLSRDTGMEVLIGPLTAERASEEKVRGANE